MRLALLAILLAACTDDPLAGVPSDCASGELHFKFAGMDQRMPLAGLIFVNAINNQPGQLHIGQGGSDEISVTFSALVPDGASTSARGFANLPSAGVDVGNCDSASESGAIEPVKNDGGYRFVIEDLHAAPYCTGAAVSGTFEACYKN
jgi:hypothetical protein